MQVGIKFSTAIHALLCAKFFENEKVTSEFIAGSINTNHNEISPLNFYMLATKI